MVKKILVVGASGRTGSHVVKFALKKNFKVVALVRNLERLDINHPSLEVIEGSPTNPEDLREAIQGCQAVICTLAHRRNSDSPWAKETGPADLFQRFTKTLVPIAKQENVSRLLYVSAWGVGDSWNKMPVFFRLLLRLSTMKTVYQDHTDTEALIEQSGLQWTIARATGLTNKPKTGIVEAGIEQKPETLQISREGLAEWLVERLDDNKYYFKKPALFERAEGERI